MRTVHAKAKSIINSNLNFVLEIKIIEFLFNILGELETNYFFFNHYVDTTLRVINKRGIIKIRSFQ